MKKQKNIYLIYSSISFLLGIGMMIWSAFSLKWLRLFIGILFIIFSIGYQTTDNKQIKC